MCVNLLEKMHDHKQQTAAAAAASAAAAGRRTRESSFTPNFQVDQIHPRRRPCFSFPLVLLITAVFLESVACNYNEGVFVLTTV